MTTDDTREAEARARAHTFLPTVGGQCARVGMHPHREHTEACERLTTFIVQEADALQAFRHRDETQINSIRLIAADRDRLAGEVERLTEELGSASNQVLGSYNFKAHVEMDLADAHTEAARLRTEVAALTAERDEAREARDIAHQANLRHQDEIRRLLWDLEVAYAGRGSK